MAGPRSQDAERLLRQIDAAVDRMRAVTPDEPYVLSIPQDEPKYHHHSRHSADLWLHRTPFQRDDHPNQQYQTFYYHEPLSDVFHLHRNSFYQQEHAPSHAPDRERSRDVPSSQSTPSMLPKKKISLAAYANKKAQPHNSDLKAEPKPTSPASSMPPRDSANLPRMLSPLHMPPRDPPQQHDQPLLPPRPLSPTLPANILASLEAHPYQPPERRNRQKHASKRLSSPLPAPDHSRKHPSHIPDPQTRDTPQQDDQEDVRPSLIVKFKIPKAMRKNLSRYLQTKPQKTIRDPPPEKPPPSSAAKRPRAADDESGLPESKRKKSIKTESALKPEPSTPAPVTPAAQKETPGTRNNKDLRTSVAMKRVESTDSMLNGTPPVTSSRQVNGTTKPSPSSGNSKTAETHAWEAESSRVGKLGRELKHAASAAAQKANSANAELAAALSLESFLCFILSFYCGERGLTSRHPPSPLDPTRTWLTLPAFIKFVRIHCHHFPQLEGLACHLGLVCNATIIQRLTSKRSPQETTPEETRALHDAAASALKASREGAVKLPFTSLPADFPKTWKRALENGGSLDEDVKPARYAGGFGLPIGMQTEPLVAVRIGHALLSEWCSRKGLGHKMRLVLNS